MISRRMVVGGLAALPATAIAERDVRGGFRPTVQAAVKVQADLNPRSSAAWWYDIVLYAMRPSEPPLALITAEGCEHNFARPGSSGGYIVRNATVSCFKDAVTGEWLDQFDNPVTGRRDIVRANTIQGGATLIAANGRDIFRDDSDMARSQISGAPMHGPVRIGSFRWLESGDRICLVKEASVPAAISR